MTENEKQGIKTTGKDMLSLLSSIGVLHAKRLTHAGYLCFTRKNTVMRNAIIKTARFKGSTMSTFIDMKEFDAGLPAVVDPVLEFVQRHTSMEVIISGKEHRSIPRNLKMTEIFHALSLIEGWGSGISRIIEWSQDNGNGVPVFKESAGAFVIVFPRRPRGQADGGVKGGVSGGVKDSFAALLGVIAEFPGERTNRIAERLGQPLGTIEKHLRKLKKSGQVEFRGSPKTGGYYVK